MLVYELRVHLILVEKGYVHTSNQMTFLQAINSITESEVKITGSVGWISSKSPQPAVVEKTTVRCSKVLGRKLPIVSVVDFMSCSCSGMTAVFGCSMSCSSIVLIFPLAKYLPTVNPKASKDPCWTSGLYRQHQQCRKSFSKQVTLRTKHWYKNTYGQTRCKGTLKNTEF